MLPESAVPRKIQLTRMLEDQKPALLQQIVFKDHRYDLFAPRKIVWSI